MSATITTEQATELLRDQLATYAERPESFPAALAARALMPHRYSVANMLLILAQSGDVDVLADRIMPRTEWAKQGFRPSGPAVAIWSKPYTGYRQADGSVSYHKEAANADGATSFTAFRLVPTYPARNVTDDDGQTGEAKAEPLAGEPADVYRTLTAWLTSEGWTVQERNVDHAGGWTCHDTKTIRIDPRFSAWDRVRVLVHETAHALMHGSADARAYAGEHRGDMEAEADGVAFAVLSAYGQDEAARRTVAYVAGWAKADTARIEAALERSSAALDAIMSALAGEPVEIRQPKTRKADNRQLAAWLRENGLPVRGPVWYAAKAGQRDAGKLALLADGAMVR